ncbi:hypothetical protein BTVI_89795 [Pitangus sulphuratus]|nr:hypothetical protein BTVI_89795 [Pitangus sulphuratus]
MQAMLCSESFSYRGDSPHSSGRPMKRRSEKGLENTAVVQSEVQVAGLLLGVVDAPFLEVFEARLDGALQNLIWCVAFLTVSGMLELDDTLGPLQHKPFYSSLGNIHN